MNASVSMEEVKKSEEVELNMGASQYVGDLPPAALNNVGFGGIGGAIVAAGVYFPEAKETPPFSCICFTSSIYPRLSHLNLSRSSTISSRSSTIQHGTTTRLHRLGDENARWPVLGQLVKPECHTAR